MSTKQRTYYTVTCDGTRHEDQPLTFADPTYQSAIEARAAAYGAGWRFPAKILADGTQSPTQVSDVCPDCIDGFEPEKAFAANEGRRAK